MDSNTNKIFFKAFINLRNSLMYQNKKMQVVTACRAIWMTPLHIVTGGLSLTLHGCPTIKRLWHKLRPLAAIRGQSVPPALRAELGRVDLPDRARGRVRKRLCAVTGTPACQLFPGRELPSPMLTAREPDEPSVSSNCLTGFTAHSHLVGGTISHFKRACCLHSALMYFHFAPALWEKSIFTERREANHRILGWPSRIVGLLDLESKSLHLRASGMNQQISVLVSCRISQKLPFHHLICTRSIHVYQIVQN